MFPHHGFGMMGNYGWIGMLVGGAFSLLFLIAFIWLIVWAVRRISGRPMHGMHMHGGMPQMGGVTPKDIAQMRYAKGEITREEYQQILDDLGK